MPVKKAAMKKAPVKKAATKKATVKKAVAKATAEPKEEDEEAEQARLEAWLDAVHGAAVQALQALITECLSDEVKASEVVLINHPSYNLELRVGGHNGAEGYTFKPCSLNGGAKFEGYTWGDTTNPWISRLWEEAGGPANGVRLLVFENGDCDIYDCNTGEKAASGSVCARGFERH